MLRDNSDNERIDLNATTRQAEKTSTSDGIILKAENCQNHVICKNMTINGIFSNIIVKTILLKKHSNNAFTYQYSY